MKVSETQVKSLARMMQSASQSEKPLSYMNALEKVSKTLGFTGWNALKPHLMGETPLSGRTNDKVSSASSNWLYTPRKGREILTIIDDMLGKYGAGLVFVCEEALLAAEPGSDENKKEIINVFKEKEAKLREYIIERTGFPFLEMPSIVDKKVSINDENAFLSDIFEKDENKKPLLDIKNIRVLASRKPDTVALLSPFPIMLWLVKQEIIRQSYEDTYAFAFKTIHVSPRLAFSGDITLNPYIKMDDIPGLVASKEVGWNMHIPVLCPGVKKLETKEILDNAYALQDTLAIVYPDCWLVFQNCHTFLECMEKTERIIFRETDDRFKGYIIGRLFYDKLPNDVEMVIKDDKGRFSICIVYNGNSRKLASFEPGHTNSRQQTLKSIQEGIVTGLTFSSSNRDNIMVFMKEYISFLIEDVSDQRIFRSVEISEDSCTIKSRNLNTST